jgi:hypothetical protein
MPLLATAVPAGHVITGPGIHEWTSWTPLAARVFAAVDADQPSRAVQQCHA